MIGRLLGKLMYEAAERGGIFEAFWLLGFRNALRNGGETITL